MVVFSKKLYAESLFRFLGRHFDVLTNKLSLYPQKAWRHCLLFYIFISFPITAFGATLQIIDGWYLDIGNQWTYDVHVTLEDNNPVDRWETRTETITGTKTVSGQVVKIMKVSDPSGTGYEYYDLTANYLLDYGYDDSEGMHSTVMNSNPGEVYPVSINTTDNNRLLGTGNYQLRMDDPYMVWATTITSYITYLRQEFVTVPAGTFYCIVVLTKTVYSDELGFNMEFTTTLSIDPSIGIVKEVESSWLYNPYDGQKYYSASTSSLAQTNIVPSINLSRTSIDFGQTSLAESVNIWNGGKGAMDYDISISNGSQYFSVTPTSGRSTSPSDTKTHTISLKRGNLPVGQTVFGELLITSPRADNSPQTIVLSATGPLFPDLAGSSEVSLEDLDAVVSQWLEPCSEPNWCEESDLDRNGIVDLRDVGVLADYWLYDFRHQTFLQDTGTNGIISIEAENYYDNTAPESNYWTEIALPVGFSGPAAMRAEPDIGVSHNTDYTIHSPRLDFKVSFTKTGTHYIWIRGGKTGGADDSLHAGIDNQPLSSCDRIVLSGNNNEWIWSNSTMDSVRATFNIQTAGIHYLNIWMREDGVRMDKIVVTTNSAYTPAGFGPQESAVIRD